MLSIFGVIIFLHTQRVLQEQTEETGRGVRSWPKRIPHLVVLVAHQLFISTKINMRLLFQACAKP